MKIYPSRENVDEFIIYLTSQEMINIKTALPICHGGTSPWTRGTITQIEQAINDNNEYRRKKWE